MCARWSLSSSHELHWLIEVSAFSHPLFSCILLGISWIDLSFKTILMGRWGELKWKIILANVRLTFLLYFKLEFKTSVIYSCWMTLFQGFSFVAPSVLFNAEIFADSAAELCGAKSASKPVNNHIHNIHVSLSLWWWFAALPHHGVCEFLLQISRNDVSRSLRMSQ